MTQQTYDANAILMGGGGAPTWKFPEPGTHKRGTITGPPEARQEREYDPNNPGGGNPKFFPSGDPIMGVIVEVQTDERDPSKEGDDGRRTFYIEGKRLKDAVKAGVRAAGARGLEVGGALDVKLTHYDTPGDRRSGCNWQVVYTPAGNNALMTEEPAQQQPVQQAAPVQQAPAPQPAPQAPPQQAAPAAQPQAQAQPAMTPEALAAFQAWQAQQQGA